MNANDPDGEDQPGVVRVDASGITVTREGETVRLAGSIRTESLTASGGWCAPSPILYSMADGGSWSITPPPTRPAVWIGRGDVLFPAPGTPEHAEAERKAALHAEKMQNWREAEPPIASNVEVWAAIHVDYEGSEDLLGTFTNRDSAYGYCIWHHARPAYPGTTRRGLLWNVGKHGSLECSDYRVEPMPLRP